MLAQVCTAGLLLFIGRDSRIRSGQTPLSGSGRPCASRYSPTPSLAEAALGRTQLPHSVQSYDYPAHIQ